MTNYKFLKKNSFEKLGSFENKVNEEAARGWKVVNFTQDHGGVLVLMEKEK